MREKRTAEVYTCDAPGCRTEHCLINDALELPDGFHGQVTQIGTWGGNGADWYACKPAHIKAAVLAALQKSAQGPGN